MTDSPSTLAAAIEHMDEWAREQAIEYGPTKPEELDGISIAIGELRRFSTGGGATTDSPATPSISHSYTIQEIDRMRKLLPEILFPMVWHSRYAASSMSYMQEDRQQQIEEHLRTYMMAGIRPEQIEEEAKRAAAESEAERLSFPEPVRDAPTTTPDVSHWNITLPRAATKGQLDAIKKMAIRLAKKCPLNLEWRLPPKGGKP